MEAKSTPRQRVIVISQVLLSIIIITAMIACVPTLTPLPPTPTQFQLPGRVVCIDFEAPLAVGTVYGAPAGNGSGDEIFRANNTAVKVIKFDFADGGGAFDAASVEAAMSSPVFGTGQIMKTNNINLEFDFSGIGFQVSQVDLEFLDKGGDENFAANESPPYVGDLSMASNSIPGANLSISTTIVTGGNTGTLTLTGVITTLLLGGQEFWIDNVCARE